MDAWTGLYVAIKACTETTAPDHALAALGRSSSSSRCWRATAWATSTLAGLLSWMERLRRAATTLSSSSLTLTAARESFLCLHFITWRPCIRESRAQLLMHNYHGSAVAVVHRLVGGIFGVKGTRRQRFRRPLLGSLAGSQLGSFGEPPVEVLVM